MRSPRFYPVCLVALIAVAAGCHDSAPVVTAGACDDERNCPADHRCVNRVCYPSSCAGGPCAAGSVCVEGACKEVACIGVSCPGDSRCEAGECVSCSGGNCCREPEACGVNGQCQRACQGGTLGACQPPGGPVDFQSDVAHCGQCGNACPTPANATAVCRAGTCARTPCAPGFFDLDGPVTFGCEATCDGGTCTRPDGGTVIVHSTLIPESGVKHGMAGGTSLGGMIQTNAEFTNQAVLGEGVPLPAAAGPIQTSPEFTNQGGFVPVMGR